MTAINFRNVDEYIASQPKGAQAVLERVRSAIRTALTDAEEVVSYKMPAYKLHGEVVVYFAGWKRHYSLYPAGAHLMAALKIRRTVQGKQGYNPLCPLRTGSSQAYRAYRHAPCEGSCSAKACQKIHFRKQALAKAPLTKESDDLTSLMKLLRQFRDLGIQGKKARKYDEFSGNIG